MTDAKPEATIVLDSVAPSGRRLTTALLTFATLILQDVHTHRTVYKFNKSKGEYEWAEIDSSKSTNSNRAKPTKQVLREVWKTPYVPSRFPKRAVTMHSSAGYLTGWRHHLARHLWLKLRYLALVGAFLLMWLPGVHKQLANRILMPWTMTTMVMTANDVYWEHFITLRNHYQAQDEVQAVAYLFAEAYRDSTPQVLAEGDWHLPFVDVAEVLNAHEWYALPEAEAILLMLSLARCARTSYAANHATMLRMRHTVASDLALAKRLLVQKPPHDGPREHQAIAHADPEHRSGNLFGWDQLRHHPKNKYIEMVAMMPGQIADAAGQYQLSPRAHDERTA